MQTWQCRCITRNQETLCSRTEAAVSILYSGVDCHSQVHWHVSDLCFVVADIVRSHESNYVILIESIQLQEHRAKPVGRDPFSKIPFWSRVGWFWLSSNKYPEVWLKFQSKFTCGVFFLKSFIKHILLKQIVRLHQHYLLWIAGKSKEEMREHPHESPVDSVWLWKIERVIMASY